MKDENELWRAERGTFQVEGRASDKAERVPSTQRSPGCLVWGIVRGGRRRAGRSCLGALVRGLGFILSGMGGY